jgi:hypothetical protein
VFSGQPDAIAFGSTPKSSLDEALALNKTNGETLISAYGDDTDVYHGKPIVLYRTKTPYQGKIVPCLRLRVQSEDADQPASKDVPF